MVDSFGASGMEDLVGAGILRNQRLAACEVAYRALGDNDDGPLRWFTHDVLRLPVRWAPYVAMALWDSNWRQASNPLRWLHVVAERAIKRWQPGLVGQAWKERTPHTVLASDLAKPIGPDGYAYREGTNGALGFHAHLAEEGGVIGRNGKIMVGQGHRRNGRRWRNPSMPSPPRKKPGESRLGRMVKKLV